MEHRLQVLNKNKGTVLVKDGRVANTPWTRLVGLMGKRSFARGQGLLLQNESAIHTFGMLIPIDVAFLSADGTVLCTRRAMPPFRIGPLVRGVKSVLELPIGTLAETSTQVGDVLEIRLL